jgi:hypothetical protein
MPPAQKRESGFVFRHTAQIAAPLLRLRRMSATSPDDGRGA